MKEPRPSAALLQGRDGARTELIRRGLRKFNVLIFGIDTIVPIAGVHRYRIGTQLIQTVVALNEDGVIAIRNVAAEHLTLRHFLVEMKQLLFVLLFRSDLHRRGYGRANSKSEPDQTRHTVGVESEDVDEAIRQA